MITTNLGHKPWQFQEFFEFCFPGFGGGGRGSMREAQERNSKGVQRIRPGQTAARKVLRGQGLRGSPADRRTTTRLTAVFLPRFGARRLRTGRQGPGINVRSRLPSKRAGSVRSHYAARVSWPAAKKSQRAYGLERPCAPGTSLAGARSLVRSGATSPRVQFALRTSAPASPA